MPPNRGVKLLNPINPNSHRRRKPSSGKGMPALPLPTEMEMRLGHHSMLDLPGLPVLGVVASGFTSTPSMRRCHIAIYASEPGSQIIDPINPGQAQRWQRQAHAPDRPLLRDAKHRSMDELPRSAACYHPDIVKYLKLPSALLYPIYQFNLLNRLQGYPTTYLPAVEL